MFARVDCSPSISILSGDAGVLGSFVANKHTSAKSTLGSRRLFHWVTQSFPLDHPKFCLGHPSALEVPRSVETVANSQVALHSSFVPANRVAYKTDVTSPSAWSGHSRLYPGSQNDSASPISYAASYTKVKRKMA